MDGLEGYADIDDVHTVLVRILKELERLSMIIENKNAKFYTSNLVYRDDTARDFDAK